MMANSYELWRQEIANPTPEEARHNRVNQADLTCGFWRIASARTKVSYPLAIWMQDGSEGNAVFFKVGLGRKEGLSLFNSVTHADRVAEFGQSAWLKCTAVTEEAYHAAMVSGRWPDGQYAREMSDAEKLDIIPDTPAEQGGNMNIGDGSFREQVVTKIGNLLEKVKTLKWPFKTLDDANAAAAIVEPLRALGKQGEAKRKELKQPWIDGAAKVDADWIILKDASAAISNLVSGIDSFKRAEEARLRREAEEAARVERERLRKEAEDRAREEAALAQREATARGEDFEAPTAEAIAEQAEAEAEQAMAAAPPKPEPTVRVGTPQGRAISRARRKVGKITDTDKFIAAIKTQADFVEFLQDKANKLARANTALEGMVIEDE